MKRSASIIVIALILAVLMMVLVPMVKRVPDRHVGVRVGGGQTVTLYDPGRHFVPPFKKAWIVYPVGGIESRFPSSGVYEATTRDGARATLALTFRMGIRRDSAGEIYRNLGVAFLETISKLTEEIVAVEMAGWPTAESAGSGPETLAAAVVKEIKPELEAAGIDLLGYRIDAWDIGVGNRAGPAYDVAPRPLRKIVFIGVDGGDWEIISPWVDRGYLPNFKRIIEGGATGRLESIEPLLSPLVWTTVATGKLPEEHGILNFTVLDPESGKKVPITRMYRKVDAFWNLLGDYGRTVGVVGWLATYPAESINGVMVTDRVGYLAYAESGQGDGLAAGSVSPEDRVDEISSLVVASSDVDYDDFASVLHISRDDFEKNKQLAFDPQNPVNNMIMLYASTLTYESIAKHLLRESPDVLAVYFELTDAAGHLFMNFAPPRQPWVGDDEFAMFKDAMLETYKLQDRIIGNFIDLCDDSTVLIIASDHGFKSGSSRPRLAGEIGGGHAAFWHQLNGIIAFYGSGVRPGQRLEEASVLDITPTILALQGLPRPADMPGKILADAFEDSVAGAFNKTVVATLQRRRASEKAFPPGDASSAEALKKLEALGYITPDNPDAHNNLGQRYQEKGEYQKAIVEFKKALAINPDFPSALNNIGVCYGRLKQYELAEQSFKRALALKENDVYAMNNLAILYLETGNLDTAVKYGEMAVRVEPNYANGHLTLGSIFATMGQVDRAEKEFKTVLELDPDNKKARENLDKLRSARETETP
ncbi:MAG: alkaline phosphatase family protein [Candidatus Latescibacterota bacterium]|nr:MAG: alkaline phosphatase family protein [Candidatus Latescibacterota bacterium]